MVHPKPDRALLFSTSKGRNVTSAVSPDRRIFHGIVQPGYFVFHSPKPHLGHYGESAEARHGEDPSHGESSGQCGDISLSLPFGGHCRSGKVVDWGGGCGDVPRAGSGRIGERTW